MIRTVDSPTRYGPIFAPPPRAESMVGQEVSLTDRTGPTPHSMAHVRVLAAEIVDDGAVILTVEPI
jgi:hypothetical protein